MKVLAIDTATTVCAAAVVSEGKILCEASLNEKYVHAEKLITQVDTVLVQSHCPLSQIDGIAISIGPGSFTGLRIGLSVAKGLAFAGGKPLVAVPTLQALAQRVVEEGLVSNDEYILSAVDARRDEAYRQWFRVNEGKLLPLGSERDVSVATVLAESPKGVVFATGDARMKVLEATSGKTEGSDTEWRCVPDAVAQCSAGTVGLIGEELLILGQLADATSLEPRYIKEFFFKQQQ